MSNLRLSNPGNSSLAKRREATTKMSNSSEDDSEMSTTVTGSVNSSDLDLQDICESSEDLQDVSQKSCGTMARFVTTAVDAVSTTLGFGLPNTVKGT